MHHFGVLVDSVLRYVGEQGLLLHCRKRQIVLLQGSSSNSLFFLNQGIMKLTATSENGKEAILDVNRAG